MRYVTADEIWRVVKNKYEGVIVASKEARRLNIEAQDILAQIGEKPTILAIIRFLQGKVKYFYEDE